MENKNVRWLLKLNLVSREDATKVIGSMETIFSTIGEAERYVRDLVASGISIEGYSVEENIRMIEDSSEISRAALQ